MVIMTCFIASIGIIGATITLLCILQNLDVTEMMPVYRPRKKKVVLTFWGTTKGPDLIWPDLIAGSDGAGSQIKLPKITFNSEPVVGSELYSKGFAVKSATRLIKHGIAKLSPGPAQANKWMRYEAQAPCKKVNSLNADLLGAYCR